MRQTWVLWVDPVAIRLGKEWQFQDSRRTMGELSLLLDAAGPCSSMAQSCLACCSGTLEEQLSCEPDSGPTLTLCTRLWAAAELEGQGGLAVCQHIQV